MIRKGFRPVFNSVKNALSLKNIQFKHQNNFVIQMNQHSCQGLMKNISYGFSQQKNNDPNA